MADEQFLLVVYDISSDKRRTKLHNVLLDFGTPVQYSVFECSLGPKALKQMLGRIKATIRPEKDRVRFYPICERCVAKIRVTSGIEVLGGEKKTVIV
ncbi:MAG: CRISPR-associated endonuclease Cas2 [Anaerolineae bacterium]